MRLLAEFDTSFHSLPSRENLPALMWSIISPVDMVLA